MKDEYLAERLMRIEERMQQNQERIHEIMQRIQDLEYLLNDRLRELEKWRFQDLRIRVERQ